MRTMSLAISWCAERSVWSWLCWWVFWSSSNSRFLRVTTGETPKMQPSKETKVHQGTIKISGWCNEEEITYLSLPVYSLSIQSNQQCFTDLATEVGDGYIECFVSIHYQLELECNEEEGREKELLSDDNPIWLLDQEYVPPEVNGKWLCGKHIFPARQGI